MRIEFEFTDGGNPPVAMGGAITPAVLSESDSSADVDLQICVAQTPPIATLKVNCCFQVGDGQTAVLYGGRVLKDTRTEFGPPVLSRIPYLSRLVTNVGYGRETQVVLILVTPRIVVQNEEEELPMPELIRETPARTDAEPCEDQPRQEPANRSGSSSLPTSEERNAPRSVPADSSSGPLRRDRLLPSFRQ